MMSALSWNPMRFSAVAGMGAALLALAGCHAVGTSSIASGRGVYNEVINRTEDEQILNMIVRLRYGQTFGMLTVASVAANVKASANAGAEFGIGPSANYDGNLVPLSAGVAYEENPTISYVPLGGEVFARNLYSPLTLEQAGLISRVSAGGNSLIRLLVNRVNGMTNPILGYTENAPEFRRVIIVMEELREARMLRLVRSMEDDQARYFIQISDYADSKEYLVAELLELLGLTGYSATGEELVIPIREALGRADGTNINVEFRSVFDLIVAAGTSMQIPSEHLEQGIVEARPNEIPPESRIMQIKTSLAVPRSASVAVKLDGWWFYIDKTDHESKRGFFLIRSLIGMRLRDSTSSQATPLMTIGVDN